MSCARAVDWHTSRHRHLVATSTSRFDRGWFDTLCGASGTPGSFRANTSKAPCPVCCDAAGIAVPNSGRAPTERGSSMSTTTKRAKTKHDTSAKASRVRTPEEVKADARAAATRAQKKGEDWTTAYVRAWRRLSGQRTTSGPVA